MDYRSRSRLQRHILRFTYYADRIMGKGFSSVVYRGQDSESSLPVAVKVIETNGYSPLQDLLLQNEIQALRMMDHPNVVRCLDVIRQGSQVFIITELCEGGDLSSLIKRKGRLQEK
jgi:serine/threonine-protein kinase ULK2